MIELTQDSPGGRFHIRGYQNNKVLINENIYDASLIVSSHTLIEKWRPLHIDDLQPSDWESVIALNPKLVLLGTGSVLRFPPGHIMAPLIEKKIGFEIMDTAAACRTFSILLAEDREVVAALIVS